MLILVTAKTVRRLLIADIINFIAFSFCSFSSTQFFWVVASANKFRIGVVHRDRGVGRFLSERSSVFCPNGFGQYGHSHSPSSNLWVNPQQLGDRL